MSILHRVRRADFLAGSLALTLAGISEADGQPQPLPIRVGATPNDTYAQAYYAADRGFFHAAGLDATVQTLNNGAAVAAAVASGALDVGVSTPVNLANAYARDVPFTMIAAGALETPKTPAGLVCAARNGPIRAARDLEGKAVAQNALKTLAEVSFDIWMRKNGADPASVRMVEMPFSAMGPALERGTVAGAVISEPALSVALATGRFRSLGDPFSAIAPKILISAWFATVPFVQQNPERVRRFREAITAAGAWANAHHDDSAIVLAKYTKMDVGVIKAMSRAPYTARLDVAEIQPELDVAATSGLLPRPVSAVTLISRLS